MKKTQSNDLALELREPYGSLVLEVMSAWKGKEWYKTTKLAIEIYTKISEIPIPLVKEAIKRYKKAKEIVPHPRYFIAIAKSLDEELKRTKKDSATNCKIGGDSTEKVNWGKGI